MLASNGNREPPEDRGVKRDGHCECLKDCQCQSYEACPAAGFFRGTQTVKDEFPLSNFAGLVSTVIWLRFWVVKEGRKERKEIFILAR